MTLGFARWLYIQRYLGPENYGLLNNALSLVGLFTAVATFGMDQLLMRWLVQRPDAQALCLGTAAGCGWREV